MQKQHIKTLAILVAILGGCTVFQAGPKNIWSSNVMRKAQELNWICVGTMKGGHIANPVTWFFPYPNRHYFVTQDNVSPIPGLTNEWLVQEYMMDFDDGQSTFVSRFDLLSNKNAYIGNVEYTNKEDKIKNMQNPEWQDIKTAWNKNIVRWIKDGKPLKADYCN